MNALDDWTQVPTGILDLAKRTQQAQAWGDEQRAKLAQTWGSVQQQALETVRSAWENAQQGVTGLGQQAAQVAPRVVDTLGHMANTAGNVIGGEVQREAQSPDLSAPGTLLAKGAIGLSDIAAQNRAETERAYNLPSGPERESALNQQGINTIMSMGGAGEIGNAAEQTVGKAVGGATRQLPLFRDLADSVTRMFHGTGADFATPDAAKFAEHGLFGPGYYLTSDPRVASSYATTGSGAAQQDALRRTRLIAQISELKDLVAHKASQYPPGQARQWVNETIPALEEELASIKEPGPNVRPVNVPRGLKLLDAEAPAPKGLEDALANHIDSFSGSLADRFTEGMPDDTGAGIYRGLLHAAEGDGAWAHSQLQAMGYDGITYAGGKRIPLMDDTGKPIEHQVVVIFPESLPKLRNTLSQTVGGSPPAVGGGVLGAAYGSTQGDTSEERAQNAVTYGLGGALGGHLLGGGQLPIGMSLKDVSSSINQVIAPAKNTAPEVQTLLRTFAGARMQGMVDAETLGRNATRILGVDNNAATAARFETTGLTHPTPTADQAALSAQVRHLTDTTLHLGQAHGYISGDVTAGPDAAVKAYFPHVYQENLNRVTAQAHRSGLNPHDFYSNSRVFPTLDEAQRNGFTPVDSFSGPIQHYAQRVSDSEAKYQLIEGLKATTPASVMQIVPGQRLPDGWRSGRSADPVFQGYAFPEPVARTIDNITNPSQWRGTAIGSTYMDLSGFGKHLLFTFSGFHNLTELRQAVSAAGGKAPQVLAQTLKSGFVPGAFDDYRLNEAPGFSAAARSGVTGLASQENVLDVGSTIGGPKGRALSALAGGVTGAASGIGIAKAQGMDDQTSLQYGLTGALGGALGGATMKVLADSLWTRQVPTLKYLTWKTQVAAGRNPEAAADFVNNTYGGQNLAAIARSKTVQDTARFLFLAPDWWESWANQLGNAFKGGDTGKMSREYWARTAVASAFTLEGLNYAFNGHFTDQNDPDHANQLETTGLYKKLGIDRRDPKTGAPIRDYMSVLPSPIESLLNLSEGRAIRFLGARVGMMPRLAAQQLTNTDYRGQQIAPQYASNLESGKLRLMNALSQIAPIGIQQIESSGSRQEPTTLGGLAAATGLRTSTAAKSTYAGPQVDSKTIDLLAQHGVQWAPTPVADSIEGFGLTRDERTRYQQIVDQKTQVVLQKLALNPAWQKLPPLEKKSVVDDATAGIKDAISGQILQSIPPAELKKRMKVARQYATAAVAP